MEKSISKKVNRNSEVPTTNPLRNRKRNRSSFFVTGGINVSFFVLVIVLLTIGLVMMFSASYASAYYNTKNHDSLYYIKRQGIFAIVGVAIMILVSKINYNKIRQFTYWIAIFALICLVVVFAFPKVNGTHRWINLGITTFQPSEIAKLALILVLAHLMARYPSRMNSLGFCAILVAIIMGTAGLVVLENHVSGFVLIAIIGFSMLFAGGVGGKHTGYVLLAIVGFAILLVVVMVIAYKMDVSFVKDRIDAWIDKSYDPSDGRWQINNSLYAIGSGGFLGSGLGQSMQKYLYVSEPQNDFVFAIVCEELGFVGAVIIIVLFALLVYHGFMIALKAQNRYGSYLTMGICFQIGIQTVLNIAVVTDSVPNTGISLPFFSYGGTSILMLLAEMGLVLSVSRTADIEKK